MSLSSIPQMALPIELLALIVDGTTPETLKTLRLVSKELNDLATPRLFAEYHMGLFGYALDNLEAIATSPLAKHIQKITIHCDILPDSTKELWRRYTDGLDNTVTEDEAFERLKFLRSEQYPWDLSGSNSLRFRECFARLDCIKEAEVLRAEDVRRMDLQDHNAAVARYWESLYRKAHVKPHHSLFFSPYSNWEYNKGPHASELASLNLMSAIAFRASFSGTQPIPRVGLSNLPHDVRQHLSAQHYASSMFNASRSTYLSRTNPCANFTELSLVSYKNPQHEGSDWSTLLRQSMNLRRLKLWCRRMPRWPVHPAEERIAVLDDFFEENSKQIPMTWPHLEYADLSIDIKQAGFVGFLRRHTSTLRTLKLYYTSVVRQPDPGDLTSLTLLFQEGDVDACFEELSHMFEMDRTWWSPKPAYERPLKALRIGEWDLNDCKLDRRKLSSYPTPSNMVDQLD